MDHRYPFFVPFCNTVIRRYPDISRLPPHNVTDAKLCHGEIHLTITAKTPLMVGSGYPQNADQISRVTFDTDARGRFRIPGSSLRGLIRQNMQILGLGIIRVGGGDEIAYKPVLCAANPGEGLPPVHRIPDDKDLLDYPRSIMGFVGRRHKEEAKFRKQRYVVNCYRSRVSFGDLAAVGSPAVLPPVALQQKLPNQADEKFVIQEPGQKFRLSGFRQYPLRKTPAPCTDTATLEICPLDTGTRFTGTIRYRNLHEDELGLLLWCLRLEAGCLHTLGMAKAYGYGQVQIHIDELQEYDPRQLYGSLTAGAVVRGDTDQRVDALIGAYRRYVCSQPGVAAPEGRLEQLPHIRHFLALKTKSPADPPVEAST